MIDPFSLAGISLGVLAIIALFVARARGWRPTPNLGDAAVVFLASWAICSGGLKVCILAVSLSPADLGSLQNERVYLFLGGPAVIWVSIQAVWERISPPMA